MRYTGGVTGYLEVLTNETNAFSGELGLVQARLNALLAVVQLRVVARLMVSVDGFRENAVACW
jgi:outer membrane protein TolC